MALLLNKKRSEISPLTRNLRTHQHIQLIGGLKMALFRKKRFLEYGNENLGRISGTTI